MRPLGLIRDERASTAAEFGLVAMIFVGCMLGIIDMARLAFEINSAKAAARHGARTAIVSSPVVAQLADFDAIAIGIPGGQPVPEGTAGTGPFVCDSTSCTNGGTFVPANFTAVLTEMRRYYGRLQPANVVIEYRHRGLGTSGFIGSDVEPLVTVRLTGLTFQPVSLQIFGVGSLPIPSVATTLTAESLGATSATI
ncbi:TadE/TadG family type IV pilus assembly protein [Phenylobacterium sp.]|jgi:hypothetical protein|uniref:TadE/TadG family type IV pilus assembly protein n=1 Tax=Phenylobacterium sp. TaxID=1871053 RepID=UPI0035B060F6